MKTLRECLREADAKGIALGHFNFSDLAALSAIVEAAREAGLPVLLGTSEGERSYVGVKRAVALVREIRDEYEHPVFLNADHTYSFEGVKEAVDVGYDAVIFDGAKLSFEENMKLTKQCVEYARSKNPDIFVEGELGYIGASSQVLDEVPEGANVTKELMTTPEEARQFVDETGVDLLAPAVGNFHGMLGAKERQGEEKVDVARVKALREAAVVPLVLHGGSGIGDLNFREAVGAGIRIVHVNTELRVAWKEAIVKALAENPREVAPYKFLEPASEAVKAVVKHKLELFSS